MGCGLSQLSRSQRARVWDVSSTSSQKSISTSGDVTIYPASSATTHPAVDSKCHSTMGRPFHRSFSQNKSPPSTTSAKSLLSHKKAPFDITGAEPATKGIMTPDGKQEKISVSSTNSTTASAGTASIRLRSSTAPPQFSQSSDKGRSSVSVKSLSDQDSGYKDDSQPEEGEDGRLSVSPWNEQVCQQHDGGEEGSSDFDSDDHERCRHHDTDCLQGKLVKSIVALDNDDTTGSMEKAASRHDHHHVTHAADIQDDHDLPVKPLCTCGYSHQKQDGYVETYDNGYLDSSYEDLRSLAHDGSVFSIDILCHSTQDGSHRQHKIPLYVHKPIGNNVSSSLGNSTIPPNAAYYSYSQRERISSAGNSANCAPSSGLLNYTHQSHHQQQQQQQQPYNNHPYNYYMSQQYRDEGLTTHQPHYPHHQARPLNPLDVQYHFHHARAQVNNRPLKTYETSSTNNHSSTSSIVSSSGGGQGQTTNYTHMADNPYNTNTTNNNNLVPRRRHTSIGGLPHTDYMLQQLDSYEALLAQHRRINTYQHHSSSNNQPNEDEILSLHD